MLEGILFNVIKKADVECSNDLSLHFVLETKVEYLEFADGQRILRVDARWREATVKQRHGKCDKHMPRTKTNTTVHSMTDLDAYENANKSMKLERSYTWVHRFIDTTPTAQSYSNQHVD